MAKRTEEIPEDVQEGLKQLIEMALQMQEGMKQNAPEIYKQMIESANKGQQR